MLDNIKKFIGLHTDYYPRYGAPHKRQEPLDFIRMLLSSVLREEEHKNDMYSIQIGGETPKTLASAGIRSPKSETERILHDALRGLNEIDSENQWYRGSLEAERNTIRQALDAIEYLLQYANVIKFDSLSAAKQQEMMEWCEHSLKKGHKLLCVDKNFFFVFTDKAEAALFKMFWVE